MSEITQTPGTTLAPPSYQGDQDDSLKKLEAAQLTILELQLAELARLNEMNLHSDLRDRLAMGDTTLPAGTLLHGTRYSPDIIESVARYGVTSGELFGVVEDAETHYCADFFRVTEDTTVGGYTDLINGQEPNTGALKTRRMESRYLPNPITRRESVAFIVDPTIPELRDLLEADAYRSGTDELFSGIINQLPIDKTNNKAERLSAILGGVPRGAVAGIIVSPALSRNSEHLKQIADVFGEDMPILNVDGELLTQDPA